MNKNDYYYDQKANIWCHEITDKMMFNCGNCFKYLFRAGRKTKYPISDYKKAIDYARQAQKCSDEFPTAMKDKVMLVAKTRDNATYHAMRCVVFSNWKDVETVIQQEIERLE